MLEVYIEKKVFSAPQVRDPDPLFSNFKLSINDGEFVCLIGPSGCGKTTLLNTIAGLDQDYDGYIGFQGDTPALDTRIGYVFQEPRLLPWRTVRENIQLPVIEDPDRLVKTTALMKTVGLAELQDTYPRQLSAGQGRRAAIARAFAVDPELLLMDEPFVSLDDPAAERLREVLLETWLAHPATVIFVTHNLHEALMLADRVIMIDGKPASIVADRVIDLTRESRRDSEAVTQLWDEFDALRRDQNNMHNND